MIIFVDIESKVIQHDLGNAIHFLNMTFYVSSNCNMNGSAANKDHWILITLSAANPCSTEYCK